MDFIFEAFASNWILFAGIFSFIVALTLDRFLHISYTVLHKVNDKSQLHGGKLVAEVLYQHGVKYIFTLVGGHISPILVAAEEIGIKVIDTRHEATAVFAADAVARLTGNIGVVAVTAGPGLTNAVTAAKNAQLAESPVLLIGGAAATILKGRGALQDIDQISLFKTICKFCGTVKTVREIVPTLRKAINIALSGAPGPVFVEFPIDTLYQYSVVMKEVIGNQKSKSLKGKIMAWYLKNYVNNIFAGAWDPQTNSPLPVFTPMPDPKLVTKCVDLLHKSKHPLLLIGSQAMHPPVSAEELQECVIKLGLPTFLGGMARGLLGQNSNIQCFHNRSSALKEADCVILAGAVCDFRLSYGRSLPKGKPIIAVNRDKKQLLKNSDIFWKPSVSIVGDVGTFIKSLSEQYSVNNCDSKWLEKLRESDDLRNKQILEMAEVLAGEFLNPVTALLELERLLPKNAILVADGGDFVGTAAYILRPRNPLSWLDPGAFGTLGVGGGFALGAQLVRPKSQVWIIYGDGSCGYSIMEYDTFVRHKIPVVSLVGNDAGWTQIEREQRPMLGSSVGCILAHTNYHAVSTSLGGEGRLASSKLSELSEAIEYAKEKSKLGHCVLINVLIGKTKFREGSISV